jgi:DNA-binding NarL/FixJ family response regulator
VTSGIQVAVVDRYLTFADTLAAGLEARDEVRMAMAHTSVASLWQTLERSAVDVALLDADLLGPDGALLHHLVQEYPDTRVVVLSSETDPTYVVRALVAGAAGWVPKDVPLDELLQGLQAVVRGESWVPGRLLTTVLETMVRAREDFGSPARLRPLTAREHQILQCMVDGLSRIEIAERLGMSPNTVRTHVHNLLHKLGTHSSLRAVAIAREAGLATTDPRHHLLPATSRDDPHPPKG